MRIMNVMLIVLFIIAKISLINLLNRNFYEKTFNVVVIIKLIIKCVKINANKDVQRIICNM